MVGAQFSLVGRDVWENPIGYVRDWIYPCSHSPGHPCIETNSCRSFKSRELRNKTPSTVGNSRAKGEMLEQNCFILSFLRSPPERQGYLSQYASLPVSTSTTISQWYLSVLCGRCFVNDDKRVLWVRDND